ncbi:MAG: UDP-N-acetylglucosamine pyrophosphorylase [Clostridiales bacterium]|nr:UDP-N-acetylglucosamine pyrophosphorylase [Clostridiales bacterium]
MFKTSDILDLSHTLAGVELSQFIYPFEIIPHIGEIIMKVICALPKEYIRIFDGVYAHKSAKISQSVQIEPLTIIGANTQVRQGAFIRGRALIGSNCVVGNSTEIKNSILFDGVQAPHFNYIGDSILGYRAHTGAGVILSNLKSDKTSVSIDVSGEKFYTGLKKLGAILGDCTEVGCNSVLNPGTVTGKGVRIYPLSCVRGIVPANSIYKEGKIIPIKR